MKTIQLGVFLILSLFSVSCKQEVQDSDEILKVVCTTGMIGDAVRNIAGENVQLDVLMGPGVDPHLYKSTQGDLQLLSDANLVFYNGLHLEGKMGDVLEKLAKHKPVIAIASAVSENRIINSTDFGDAHDPHIWFDVSIWLEAVKGISRELIKIQPDFKDEYKQSSDTYIEALATLHNWVGDTLQEIPTEQRVMITAHDAFQYFGNAYDVQVKGLQGISTVSEYGLRDVTELVNFIVERKIKSVFVESSVPTKSLEAVIEGCSSKGHPVKIGGTLYSDAMGEFGTVEGTYIGMVQANVRLLVEGLK